MKYFLIGIAILSIVGCVYTPKIVTVYDEECNVEVRQMELESKQIAALTACENDKCAASILGAVMYSMGSVIVSGSIVVTSNVVYWFEKQNRCK
jgi:hypothetical protein